MFNKYNNIQKAIVIDNVTVLNEECFKDNPKYKISQNKNPGSAGV